jgi:methylated-DNA-protein-cysteine methyltransferase related protein
LVDLRLRLLSQKLNLKMKQSSNFQINITRFVERIPEGKVASYGQIASYIGHPKLARQVGWTLARCGQDLPWWRVVSGKGMLSIKNNWSADKNLQKKLLEREGIEVGDDFKLDMDKYRWIVSEEDIKTLRS